MRAFAFLAIVPLAACSFHNHEDRGPAVPASGSGTTRTYAVADFTGLSLRGSDDADVRVGTGFSVRAEGPSTALDKLRIVRDGDTLRIGRKTGSFFSWGDHHDAVKIFVTMPRLASVAIAGSGDMTVDRVEGERFEGDTAGSGTLTIANLAVRDAKLAIAGSGDMAVKGAVDHLDVSVAGSGGVEARGLKAAGATVAVMGSGGVAATVTGPASVTVMGSGDVDLGSGAKCSTTKMGSGEVKCGG